MSLMEIAESARSLWVLWLMILFLGIIFWVFRPSKRQAMDDHAHIPLRDEEEEK